MKVGKVPGAANPANCLTEHLDAKLKEECVQDLGLVDFTNSELYPMLEAAEQIELVAAFLSCKGKPKPGTLWKPNFATAADALQVCMYPSLIGRSTCKTR